MATLSRPNKIAIGFLCGYVVTGLSTQSDSQSLILDPNTGGLCSNTGGVCWKFSSVPVLYVMYSIGSYSSTSDGYSMVLLVPSVRKVICSA